MRAADRVAVALGLLLVLVAFSVKPVWQAVDRRMRVHDTLVANAPRWSAIDLAALERDLDLDQRSVDGVDPWGRPWARALGGSVISSGLDLEEDEPSVFVLDHELEPGVSTYSAGPDGVPERGAGDDVVPYASSDWRVVTCERACLLFLGLGGLLAFTYGVASRVPRKDGLAGEALFVVTLAWVPALACTVGVSVNFDALLTALAPLLLWSTKGGLTAALLGSMLLVWSIWLAAVRLRLAPQPTTEPT